MRLHGRRILTEFFAMKTNHEARVKKKIKQLLAEMDKPTIDKHSITHLTRDLAAAALAWEQHKDK